MVMPSQADGRALATHIVCLLVAVTGLAVIVVGAIYPERRLGTVGIACLLLGGSPLVMDRYRRQADADRSAAHNRFLTLEQAERQRTRDYVERELAWLEETKREAMQAIEDRRATITGEQFTQALHLLADGELDSGGVIRRFPRPATRNSAEKQFEPPASGGRN